MKKIFFCFIYLSGCLINNISAQSLLPLQKGMTVFTHKAIITSFQAQSIDIVDTRNPPANGATHFSNWHPTIQHFLEPHDEVFGVTIDNKPNPNIYVTPTTCYLSTAFPATSNIIYKINGTTGAVGPYLFGSGPNTIQTFSVGYGNICFDGDHNQLFVTTMHDGKIYRISVTNTTGTILSSFDPFTHAPYPGTPAYAPLATGERLWGIGYYKNKVYFSVWACDEGRQNGNHNTIWSIDVDPVTGNFIGPEKLEITIPFLTGVTGGNYSNPVSCISFSSVTGNMLLAERTMLADNGNSGFCWDNARVMEYVGSSGAWLPSPNQFFTNATAYNGSCNISPSPPLPGTLCSGGACYQSNQFVIASGAYFFGSSGLSIMPFTGNSLASADALNYYADIIPADNPGCLVTYGDNTIVPPPCYDCIGSFGPQLNKKYLISGWVKDANAPVNVTGYTNPKIEVQFDVGPNGSGGTVSAGIYPAAGQVIDGWQRIEGEFLVPANAFKIRIKLECGSGSNSQPCLFDDIRVFPFDGSMKSYVYDPDNLRLVAELDERNYATLYEYDEEGKLTRVKKETEKGKMTIKESKNSTHKK